MMKRFIVLLFIVLIAIFVRAQNHKAICTFWALIFILLPIGLIFAEISMFGQQSVSIITAFPIEIIICMIIYSYYKDANIHINRKPA